MAKKTLAERFPMLKEAWEAYGFAATWDDVVDVKMRSDACYCVVRFKDPNVIRAGTHEPWMEVADFVRGDPNDPWEVQNDGHNAISDAEWKELRIVPDCDWFEIPSRK